MSKCDGTAPTHIIVYASNPRLPCGPTDLEAAVAAAVAETVAGALEGTACQLTSARSTIALLRTCGGNHTLADTVHCVAHEVIKPWQQPRVSGSTHGMVHIRGRYDVGMEESIVFDTQSRVRTSPVTFCAKFEAPVMI